MVTAGIGTPSSCFASHVQPRYLRAAARKWLLSLAGAQEADVVAIQETRRRSTSRAPSWSRRAQHAFVDAQKKGYSVVYARRTLPDRAGPGDREYDAEGAVRMDSGISALAVRASGTSGLARCVKKRSRALHRCSRR